MGNTASSSGKHSHGHNIRDETVDFGHLTPQGIYTGAQDWNQQVVGKLIVDRKLAPFYRPLEDYEANWDDETILRNRKLKTGEEALPPPVSMPVSGVAPNAGKSSIKGKGVADRRETQRMSEAEVYHGATECPICFMYYPPNINRSRCCDQAICTECFVQIKRSEPTTTHIVSEPAACPYCVQENFGVTYEPPSWRAGLLFTGSSSSHRPELSRLGGSALSGTSADSQGHLTSERARRKSVPYQAGEVVTIDLIRPDWEAKLEAVRAAVTRRANRRIVMRQVGDRLIPVGITSGRVVPVNLAGGEADAAGGSGRRSRRQRNAAGGSEELPMGMTGHDLEELMMMEAMRLSLLEHEAQQQRERQAAARNTASNPDANPPRDTANVSPDPASQLNQGEAHQSDQLVESDLLGVATPSLPPSSGANTPLEADTSRASESNSHQSASVSPRPSFDASLPIPSSHRRVGSGPIQASSSPLNGAAGLAMAFGFPSSTPVESNIASNATGIGTSGFTSRTLNTLSAAVAASSVPVAIAHSSTNDLAGAAKNPSSSGTNEAEGPRGPELQAQSTHNELASDAGALQSEDQVQPPTHDASTAPRPPVSLATTIPQLDNDSVANSPVVTRASTAGNQSSANFLTAEARALTAGSVMTMDSQQSKGEDYDVLISSPETEMDEPLMSGPPNLARLDTEDFDIAQSSAGGSGTA
ncbi:hypothetical protein BDV93DRAFT_601804 [Ceratobasidium sp. AG-I]|nr:hypothetical protein BDV93DRAFT_601804 [Ceratobasidium sp. AG-I]